MRYLPQNNHFLGHSDLRPLGCHSYGYGQLFELPQQFQSLGQTDKSHSDQQAVRHLPQQLRGIRTGSDESRRARRTMLDLPQRVIRFCQRAGETCDSHPQPFRCGLAV